MINKRFVIISSYTLPDHSGSGIHAFKFAQYLIQNNCRTNLLTYNRNLKLTSSETISGVDIKRIPYFNKSLIFKFLSLPLIFISLVKNLMQTDIVVIYGCKLAGFRLIIILSWLMQKKIIFRSTLIGVDDFKTMLSSHAIKRIFTRILFKIPMVYFSINRAFSQRFVDSNLKSINLFESVQGVNTKYYKKVEPEEKLRLRMELNLPQDKQIIICPGLLIKRKGFDELFQKLGKLKSEFLLLVVGLNKVGENHFLADFQDEMNELKSLGHKFLDEKIKFIGNTTKIKEYLQASDIFILNSKAEGLPNVLLEAMAVGLPIITRKLEGLSNFVTFNNKNCLEYENPEEINNLITKLQKDESLSTNLGQESYKMAQNNFSFDVVTKKLFQNIYL